MAIYTLFGQSGGAALATDAADYTMGMQFTLSQNAALTGIWWNSPSGAAALPDGSAIYQITGTNTGSQVTGTFHNPPTWGGAAAGSGWVKEIYDGTVTLTASVNYRVCVHLAFGGGNKYGATANYWSSSGQSSGIITAPAAGAADGGNQDAFINTTPIAYPNTSFNSANYWVDVEVTTGGPAPGPSVAGLLAPESGGVSGWVMLPVRGRAGSAV